MTPFAELLATMNTAIDEFLSDEVADFGGGVTVPGQFRDPPAEAFGMISGNRPSFEATSAALAGVEEGDLLTIDGVQYAVAELQAEQGMTTLTLGKV